MGKITMKIIAVPCAVNRTEYVSASTIVGPGKASSVLIKSARQPAITKLAIAKTI
jgi:hypothetical protein